MAVKKRCNFCRKYLRSDGTCQNTECPRYVPEPETETDEKNETEESK